MEHFELLAPAGDFEALRAAFYFGADAVYLGGPFMQLRASSAGFDENALSEAVAYAHNLKRKVYVTVNSFAQNGEIALLSDYARQLYGIGVNAAIISDIGVLSTFKTAAPDLEVHISTQANCMNYAAAKVYYEMGAKRVVLARELSLEDIAEIRSKVPKELELEAFVHGAMCMAYSGRCLISSYMTGRSGNRGGCTQPCRWKYFLYEENRPGEFFRIEESEGKSAVLSSHDMNMIHFLDELKKAGVISFKIEGRMKTAYYVAVVTNAYRKALDGSHDFTYLDYELDSINHRPYSTGFYFGELKKNCYNDGEYIQHSKFVALVLGWENGVAKLQQRNHFAQGDTLEIVSPKMKDEKFKVEKITDEAGNDMTCAPHPKQTLYVPCKFELNAGDMLRRRSEV